jgi:hypothetical protein
MNAYAIAISAARDNIGEGTVSLRTKALVYFAHSEEEAFGMGYKYLEKSLPSSAGWQTYVVDVVKIPDLILV